MAHKLNHTFSFEKVIVLKIFIFVRLVQKSGGVCLQTNEFTEERNFGKIIMKLVFFYFLCFEIIGVKDSSWVNFF